ncbi:hypothetical protein GQ457_17G010650 [Hibiscus cannabinus]
MDVGVEEISGAPTDSIMDAPGDYMTRDEGDLKQGSGAQSNSTFQEMLIGRRIFRIDYNTTEGKRGCFTRFSIVVDLNKPLVPGIIIDGVQQRVEYKGLPTICYSCGRYAHTDDVCKKVMEEMSTKQRVVKSDASSALPKDRFRA